MLFWGRKKETPQEKQERLDRIHAEMQRVCNQGKEKYDKLCAQVNRVLETANKPNECNVVHFVSEPFLFPKLKSYQCFNVDWEIWRYNDIIYIYRSEVEDYPQEYYGGDAPAIAQISVTDIQHFRIEGNTYAESKISGGTIKQDRRTGRIKQTPLKTHTIEHDTRVIKLSIVVNGIVKTLDFDYSSLDVLCLLIPEKERK